MRLLGITNLYPPHAGGGYGEICADVMSGLAARGHDVTMLVAHGESGRGVDVHAELQYVLAPWRHPVGGLRALANDERVVREAVDRGIDAALVWHMRGLVNPPLTLLHRAGIPSSTSCMTAGSSTSAPAVPTCCHGLGSIRSRARRGTSRRG